MAIISASPTQPEMTNACGAGFCLKIHTYSPIKINASVPRNSPFNRPTLISLMTRWTFCFPVRFSSTRTRMVTARDWVPTFPAISRIKDWKHITTGITATTVSKMPTTEDTPRPSIRRIISQGSLFFILSLVVSSKSSSAVKPASFA